MPKISIVVPVHNVEGYLRGCLDSAVGQTLQDIEVICVDDNSDDASAVILREYAALDSRVRVITFSENKTASQARKDGVLAATGDYIMFLDADDTLALNACEELYGMVQHEPVDILHFGTYIESDASLPPERIDALRRFIRPHDGTLEDGRILEGAFSAERTYNFTLWDKLYSADLCKRSFSRIKDGRFPKAQDKYAYFVISYYARTYRGVPDEALYHYHFGRGVTGHQLLSIGQFERYCSMALVADAIKDFLLEEGALDRHETLYASVRSQLLRDCVANWNSHISEKDRAVGFDLMLTYWEPTEVVAKVAELNWANPGHIARVLRESPSVARKPREARVVGTYYHRYANGGIQRVLSILIELWLSLGYEVVLFTDLPPSPDDCHLPDGVTRVVLPSFFDVNPANYVDRAREIRRTIQHFQIDVMVYHAWVSPILLWDLLVCKTADVGFICHCHSVFSQPLRNTRKYFADMPAVYGLSDAIVTLSEVDELYWSNFNDCVIRTVNPLPTSLDDVQLSELTGKNVLWLGRMSEEKRPHDALRIFHKVLESEPDAKLFMVGSSPRQGFMDGVYALVDELDMRDSVIMCGFHKEVQPFYSNASVFLLTSDFEGYPMTLAESQSAGLPCVMYDLPYLTLTRRGKGFVAVEMCDINAAADAVVDLLRDPDYRRSLGRDARANIEHVTGLDLAGLWRDMFHRLSRPVTRRPLDSARDIMWETLLDHYRTGAVGRELESGQLKSRLAAENRAQRQLQRVRGSLSFKVGRLITLVPRKLRDLVRRLRSS